MLDKPFLGAQNHWREIPSRNRKARQSAGFFIFAIPRGLLDRSSARLKYASHKANAARRGIAFEMSFEEWWQVWEPHWDKRGVGSDELGMCRTRDLGPYRADNIRLDTPKGNAGDRVLMRRRPWMAERPRGSSGGAVRDRGFSSAGSKFPTPEEALEQQQEEYEWIPGE